MSTFTNTSAQLVVDTGYGLGLAPGTDKVVTDIKGWFTGAAMRRTKTSRMGEHGNFSERGFRDARYPSVSGAFYAASRGDAAAFVDEINAYLGEGTQGTLTVSDPDLGTRSATVFLMTPDVTWDGGLLVEFALDLEAPDPRKYGDLVTAQTGVAVPGGGLIYPLFSGGRGALVRQNDAPNPYGVNAYQKYASGVGTITPNVAVTGNPDGIRTANRVAWNAGENNPGAIFLLGPANNTTYTMSAWVYVETAGSGMGFAQSGVTGSTTITPAVGTWQRISWTYTTGTSTNGFGLRCGGAQASAGSFLITGVVVEKSSTMTSPAFGGSTIRTGYSYAWTGTPNASPSQEYVLNRTGVLDFGTPGSTGRVSITNEGRAESPLKLTVTGPAPNGFTITDVDSGRRLVYTAPILAGQTIVLDARTGTVKLDGYADRAVYLTERAWPVLAGGDTATFSFEAPGSTSALLSLEVYPAWW